MSRANGLFIHPMHIHGGPFEIVETDGNPVPEGARFLKDTVNVGPRRALRRDLDCAPTWEVAPSLPYPHHTTNDNVEDEGAGGLTSIIEVSA